MKKYTLLIADDESIERKAMRVFIMKNFPSIDVIGEATNGSEALELAQLSSPDILIIDINMPELNGLEAIKSLRSTGCASQIIVNTAYNYFEYARDSLNYGADYFLLKPVKHDDWRLTLEKCLKSIDQTRAVQSDAEIQEESLRELLAYIEKDFISAVISLRKSANDLQMCLKNLGFANDSGCLASIAIPKEEFISNIHHESAEKIQDDVRDIIKDLTKRYNKYLIGQFQDHLCPIFISLGDTHLKNVVEISELPLFEYLVTEIYRQKSVHIRIGIGAPFSSIEEAKRSYLESQKVLNETSKDNPVVCFSSYHSNSKIDFSTIWQSLSALIDKGDYDNLLKSAKDLYYQLNEDAAASSCIELMREHVIQIIFILSNLIDSNLTSHNLDWVQFRGKMSSELAQMSDENELESFLEQKSRMLIKRIVRTQPDKPSQLINDALLYIFKNSHEDLSLNLVADAIGISSFYLSHLFTREIKRSFIDYLTDVRMKKLMSLIKQGDYTVNELSELTGYHNTTYFCKVVKKNFGKTVGELKKEYASDRNANINDRSL